MFRVGNSVRFVGEISNYRLGGIIKKDGTVGKKGIWRLNNKDIYEVLKVHENDEFLIGYNSYDFRNQIDKQFGILVEYKELIHPYEKQNSDRFVNEHNFDDVRIKLHCDMDFTIEEIYGSNLPDRELELIKERLKDNENLILDEDSDMMVYKVPIEKFGVIEDVKKIF